jgi:hypothetical protein
MDNPFFSLVDDDGSLYGYSANGNTEIIAKGALDNTMQDPLIALHVGDKDDFDECGAWLNSAFGDGDKVRGWYHAEGKCDYEVGQTYKSVAYCESVDGGTTFDKSSFPQNQILTGMLPPTAGRTVGNGDHSVVVGDDGYYYVYFINWDDYGLCVARSSISSGGVPGSWWKYFQGEWSEPGLGGNATRIDGLVGSTVYKHTSGNLLSVGNGYGISLSFGANALSWKEVAAPLLYAERSQWDRTTNSTELIAYPAFVPAAGGTGPIANNFWLYYTYLEPGAIFSQRYLVRRSVTVSITSSPNNIQVGVELSRYRAGATTWVTTAVPLAGNFSYNQSLGYMLTAQYANTVPLYDCYIDDWQDYMLNNIDCRNYTGMTYLRHMGWVYASKQQHTSPLYRCWNVNTRKHSVSNQVDCEGNGYMEFILGWTLDR